MKDAFLRGTLSKQTKKSNQSRILGTLAYVLCSLVKRLTHTKGDVTLYVDQISSTSGKHVTVRVMDSNGATHLLHH